ncbi:putative membrane protein [Paenibacillus algorifonticola]|uniref:Putative membrane protein n=1 Tax=Paenibacillus algorifonticola TaxID=684063 RepID=A0A1I2HIJ7_9BACL|nr:PH domain-containing protein [Paenibacillus algorifonticola]SFF29233.1 putative membrane protein [Paenibacillus algorifonticola]
MNNPRRLHKVFVVFTLFQFIKGLLPLIFITLLRKSGFLGLEWYWYAGAAGLILLALFFGCLEWRAFTYTPEADRIVIRKGVLFKDEKTIYYGRIHSVNVEQPFLQRILGVAELKIETPGGGKKADGILPALTVRDAEQLRQQLLSRQHQTADRAAQQADDSDSKVRLDKDIDMSKHGANAVPMEDAHGFSANSGLGSLNQSANGLSEQEKGASHTIHQSSSGQQASNGGDSAYFRLTNGQLLLAAATSMNLGLALAFIAGIYSFADDFLEKFAPMRIFEMLYAESKSLVPGYVIIGIAVAAICALAAGWALSLILYIIKYSGFTVHREGKRISVSYGMLDKKTYLFDPNKVQSVIIEEGIFRQMIGYAQIKLQVVSSDKNEQLMLHPFVSVRELEHVISHFVPQMKLMEINAHAPKRALLYYMRIELAVALVLCGAAIGFWPTDGLWSLMLIPIVYLWRRACHKAAGVRLENGQLILRRRNLARITYLIRRPQIVAMKVKRSWGQQRKGLVSLGVRTMGNASDYTVAILDHNDVEPVWNWFSREQRQ